LRTEGQACDAEPQDRKLAQQCGTHRPGLAGGTCVAAGVDYFDLCGEPIWMRQKIEQHEAAAKKSGARIVFSCGFDSVPFEFKARFVSVTAVLCQSVSCSPQAISPPPSEGVTLGWNLIFCRVFGEARRAASFSAAPAGNNRAGQLQNIRFPLSISIAIK
jgi:hypothetical protein